MTLGHKRSDLQKLAEVKIADAILLFDNKRYSNAYYLAGYAIEFALKACIAKQMVADMIPDKAFVNSIYQHSFKNLVGSAGLNSELKKKQDSDSAFGANWAIVSEWDPQTRYDTKDPLSAQVLISAIQDAKSGVLPWIKEHW